nr:MAG TPA: hypothetical protein [Caudoviricetes sp.]
MPLRLIPYLHWVLLSVGYLLSLLCDFCILLKVSPKGYETDLKVYLS